MKLRPRGAAKRAVEEIRRRRELGIEPEPVLRRSTARWPPASRVYVSAPWRTIVDTGFLDGVQYHFLECGHLMEAKPNVRFRRCLACIDPRLIAELGRSG